MWLKNAIVKDLLLNFKVFYDVEGASKSRVPQRWLLTINITHYDDELKDFYKKHGGKLEDRLEAVNDPSFLEYALSNGQPEDQFKRIYSTTELNGFVSRKNYIKAINEILFQWNFHECKLLFIFIAGHGAAGDKILFSDGRTAHFTEIIEQFRNKYAMMNKPIICLNNSCRPSLSNNPSAEPPLHARFIIAQKQKAGQLRSDTAIESFEYYDDRGPHHSRLHTGKLLFILRIMFEARPI